MALLAAADYLVDVDFDEETITEFLNQDKIEVLKKTKKSEKVVDIKPMIYKLEKQGDKLFVCLAHGSQANLKPNLVIEALCDFADKEMPEFLRMTRLEMYYEKDGKLVPLEEV